MKNDTLWFKCWPAGVPKHIKYTKGSLQEILRKTALTYQEKTAIVYGEREISYAQLELFFCQISPNLLLRFLVH